MMQGIEDLAMDPSSATVYRENLVKLILEAIGDDPKREGLADTPARVVRSWKDLFSGYGKTAKEVLGTTFASEGYDQMVICRDIELYSTCEHHMLPFVGKAHIAYVPGERVVGLSKLARLVEVFSRRLQIQERLTKEIGEALEKELQPKGVAVLIESKHFCMCSRGVQKQNSLMITSHLSGCFKDQSDCRAEFLQLVR